jgi:hypothetical protein
MTLSNADMSVSAAVREPPMTARTTLGLHRITVYLAWCTPLMGARTLASVTIDEQR